MFIFFIDIPECTIRPSPLKIFIHTLTTLQRRKHSGQALYIALRNGIHAPVTKALRLQGVGEHAIDEGFDQLQLLIIRRGVGGVGQFDFQLVATAVFALEVLGGAKTSVF